MAVVKNGTSAPEIARPAEGAFRHLARTIGLVERVMHPYFARFGISGTQWGVLRTLYRFEQEPAGDKTTGLRLTDLSQRLLIRPPSVTGVVDRLERAGFVARHGFPTDLRSKCVALTEPGRELVKRVLAIHSRQMDAVLGGLTQEEQTRLCALLERLDEHLESLLED